MPATAVLPPPPRYVQSLPQPVRWTCEAFHNACDAGLFEGRNVILVHGEILELPMPNPPHNTALGLMDDILRTVFVSGFHVRNQMAVDLNFDTDPGPDLSVVVGQRRDYATRQATTAVLVVEVSDTTIVYDAGEKANLYAAGGIPDYWVVDVSGRRLLVFRDPKADATQTHGHVYAQRQTFTAGQSVAPLAAPNNPVAVDDILP